MIDGFISTIVNALISQGGGWLVAVMLGIVVYIMDKRLSEAKHKTECDLRDQYEKRLAEFRELIDVTNTSTQTLNAMQASVTASTEATNQLSRAFATLLREIDGQKARSRNSSGLGKELDELRQSVEAIQRGNLA